MFCSPAKKLNADWHLETTAICHKTFCLLGRILALQTDQECSIE